MEVVNKYSYLGFVFTTALVVKQGTYYLVAKGKKAVFNLCTSFEICKEMTKETFFKMFDLKIQSVLLCSSEIWGLHRLDSSETAHLMACKRYLGVPICTPNKMVNGESGRFPLFVALHVRRVKYWFRHFEWNRPFYLIRITECLLVLMKMGKLIGNGERCVNECPQHHSVFQVHRIIYDTWQ